MFDFNNVLNNSDSVINNIQQNLLDIRVIFFNCYKLFINVEKTDNGCYLITNLVVGYKHNENNRNDLITYDIFASLLDTEFNCTGMLKNKNNELIDVYTSKYFKIFVIKSFDNLYPLDIKIKFNDNIDIQELVRLSDISDYNNALNDINRVGCTDIMSYVRFIDIMRHSPKYTIGDNVLDTKFNKYCKKGLNVLQELYNNSIFYMDKTNTKFYFILSESIIGRISASKITSIIDCPSAWHILNNNYLKHNNTISEKFLIGTIKNPAYHLEPFDKREINITITDNADNTNIPDYILRKFVCLSDIRKTKTYTNDYRIIIVEHC